MFYWYCEKVKIFLKSDENGQDMTNGKPVGLYDLNKSVNNNRNTTFTFRP